ncbi:N-formylglutamate deformylase [Aliiruegeria lutimaris]|uniref:Formiminoglutamase n=1 Tax=Aliiruegeria lutimaris TaxID=571298 RepID=A0A1G9K0W7_9RHOB|nr:N-formylglutamate deformylase [Aliiruegeria lutimaris]SDL43408.1 formiminoglutamase [Aliiruegeria lutimaris]
MSFVEISRGDTPLVLGLPHTGTDVPEEIWDRLNETGRALADTDWHIHELYAGLVDGATTVRTTIHRYVIDANRDPGGVSLYPGQNTTTLCPLTDFDGKPIWREGEEPDAEEIARRTAAYHAPYHEALTRELERVRSKHGFAILYDCHSIRSEIPFLFEGTLPDLNIGTNDGLSCAPEIQAAAWENADASPYRAVLNGRFKGGWTTRHYGRPTEDQHAIQMEIAQSAYLDEETPPWRCEDAKAALLRSHLKNILNALVDTAMEIKP